MKEGTINGSNTINCSHHFLVLLPKTKYQHSINHGMNNFVWWSGNSLFDYPLLLVPWWTSLTKAKWKKKKMNYWQQEEKEEQAIHNIQNIFKRIKNMEGISAIQGYFNIGLYCGRLGHVWVQCEWSLVWFYLVLYWQYSFK